ncbi:NADH:flavin oxidoreductase / NADH oxidase family domain-containing protein [Trichoderma breve]|uniref:NADH:flavin oxidoreductase / NADH oxidase family domain-containing protein n=1 Tax=Trichoderma breve TaxID=2034170 RepID=A0A9W9E532_9HYPO|nr:NADH:flavin oxidoreductase / NADH oxidase family domain-containing protein [Trichoderma breve]KAJ4859353.1 NADH:flavin oxidoreductase / NADH oxidase family domain-containing protein [Trichoderma breve]
MTVSELKLQEPITLPCGLTLPNRLSKAAMAESWADNEYLPGERLFKIYENWAEGGWGSVLTGNVQVDVRYLGSPADVSPNENVDREKILAAWKKWAKAASKNDTPVIMQINHPGRQSPGNGILARLARSFVFGSPREMTLEDIQHVVSQFAETAKLAAEAGFAGVELHGAHGYLLSQFLNPASNTREDEYGGSAKKRAKIVVDILKAVREVVPKGFCVGIKLNSADFKDKEQLAACIEQLEEITAAGVDLLEISGGSYEDPSMMQESRSASTLAREAFFLDFAKEIRDRFRHVPLMVTGGFRTREGMEAALREDACDIVGIGRPAALNPFLPKNLIFNKEVKSEDARAYTRKAPDLLLPKLLGVKVMAGGAETSWYMKQMRSMPTAV